MKLTDLFYQNLNSPKSEIELNQGMKSKTDEVFKTLIEWDRSKRSDKYKYIYRVVNQYNKKIYPLFNQKFKKIFDNNSYKSKQGGIYIRNFYGVKLSKLLDESLNFKSMNISTHTSYAYHKFIFNEESLNQLIFFIAGLIYAYSGRIVPGQIYMAYLSAVIEFFDIKDIDWNKAHNHLFVVLESYEFNEINDFIVYLRSEKQKSDNLRTSKKKGKEHKKKILFTRDEVLKLKAEGKTQTIIKKELSIKYACSEKTIQRLMKSMGLTRVYQNNL